MLIATFTWKVLDAEAEAAPVVAFQAEQQDPLGSGIVRPFRRTERADFAMDSGVPEVLSSIGQLLGTQTGTLPWLLSFGCDLEPLRHKKNAGMLVELARVRVEQALRNWTARAELRSIRAERPVENEVVLIITLVIGGALKTLRVTI